VGDMHYSYCLGFRVDDVQHAPVANPNAPLIFEALELFAACWPRIIGKRQNFAVYPFERCIVKRIEFFCADCLIARVC
jgi:hypothetical protein